MHEVIEYNTDLSDMHASTNESFLGSTIYAKVSKTGLLTSGLLECVNNYLLLPLQMKTQIPLTALNSQVIGYNRDLSDMPSEKNHKYVSYNGLQLS